MRWQRIARMVVAAAGVGAAITLYVRTRERPVADPQTNRALTDPQASVQAGPSTQVRYRDNNKQFTIEASASRQYPDGRTVLENPKLTLEDGTVVTANLVETKGAVTVGAMPQEFLLKGDVKFDTPDAVQIRAQEATVGEASGHAVLPGPVSFVRGRMSGTGTGGTYERDTGVFKLLADAHVVGAANEQGGAIDATAATLTFNRAGKALLFDGSAKISTDADVMTADRATLYLTENNEQFRLIELRGQSRVMPAPGKPASGTPDMRAMDIDMAFHEGTQALQRAVLTKAATMVLIEGTGRRSIEATSIVTETAPDGKTLTLLDARERVTVRTPARDDAPARVITAATLLAAGDAASGLTGATFAGGVSFTETTAGARGRAATQRTGTSQTMQLKLRGQLDAIDEAQFQQDATFKDGDVTGDADLGIYRAAKGQLTLQPVRNGRRPPHVRSGDVTVDATELIDVDLNTKDLHARGDVKTVTSKAAGAKSSSSAGALFNDKDPMYGFAVEFWYEGKSKKARYQGALALVRQGESVIQGRSVELSDETRDLSARGAVDSVMMLASSGGRGAGAPKLTRVTAASLDYVDQAREATYAGGEGVRVVMTGADGVTTSNRMVMTLARESRSLERLDARGAVEAKLTDGSEAVGESLLYDAATQKYTLRGQPVVMRTRNKSGSCSVWQGRVGYFTSNGGAPEFPEAENNPGGTENRDAPCTGALQK